MKNRPTLIIDGVDFTNSFNKYGYGVSYSPVSGVNGGIMKDGSETVDIVAWKAVLELPCNGMKSADISAVVLACKKTYVTVKYFDVATGAEKTSVFIPSIGKSTYRLTTPSGDMCFSGLVIKLRER